MRKTILFVVGLIVALLGFLQQQAGLSINPVAIGAGLVAITAYLFGEAKNDMARIKSRIFQEGKWRDPTFWISLVAAFLPIINEQFKLNIPIETIIAVLTSIVGIIFVKRHKELTS